SWEDKVVYPKLRVVYLCGDKFFAPEGEFKSVSAKDLSYIYKDLLGAIVVENSEENPMLKKGDIILKLEGNRIENLAEFYYRFQHDQEQNLEVLRDGKRLNVSVKAEDVTEKVL